LNELQLLSNLFSNSVHIHTSLHYFYAHDQVKELMTLSKNIIIITITNNRRANWQHCYRAR